MSFNLPTNEICVLENPALWIVFKDVWAEVKGFPANPALWTEAEVVQWLDHLDDVNIVVDRQDYSAIMSA